MQIRTSFLLLFLVVSWANSQRPPDVSRHLEDREEAEENDPGSMKKIQPQNGKPTADPRTHGPTEKKQDIRQKIREATEVVQELSAAAIAGISISCTVILTCCGCLIKLVSHARELRRAGDGFGDYWLEGMQALFALFQRRPAIPAMDV